MQWVVYFFISVPAFASKEHLVGISSASRYVVVGLVGLSEFFERHVVVFRCAYPSEPRHILMRISNDQNNHLPRGLSTSSLVVEAGRMWRILFIRNAVGFSSNNTIRTTAR